MIFYLYGVTGDVSLVQDGAVGACMIQASTHVCLGVWGAAKLLPSDVDQHPMQVVGDFSPEGGGFAWHCTKPAEFSQHSQLLFI